MDLFIASKKTFISLLLARRLFNRAFCNCIQGWIYICKFSTFYPTYEACTLLLRDHSKSFVNLFDHFESPKNNFHICVHLSVLLNEDLISHFVKKYTNMFSMDYTMDQNIQKEKLPVLVQTRHFISFWKSVKICSFIVYDNRVFDISA